MTTLLVSILFLFVNVGQSNDSLKNLLNQEQPVNVNIVDERGWFEKNSVALIGAFGGALTAILAAFLTNLFANRNRKKKDKKIYQGVLYSIHTELHWQQHYTEAFKNQIDEIERISKLTNEFCVEKAPNSYDTRYLEYCRQRLLEYDNFNHKIVALLSTHINKLNETNDNVDFKVAQKMKLPEGELLTEEAFEKYFDKIRKDNIEKIEYGIPLIRTLIEHELKKFPKDLFVESEIEKQKKKAYEQK